MIGGIGIMKAAFGAMLLGGAIWAARDDGKTETPALATISMAVPAKPQPVLASAPAPAPAVIPAAARSSAAPASDTFVVKRVLSIDGPFKHGDYVWDTDGAPAGPIVITVDLAAQTLSVFRGGYEIGAAVILYGADNKPTPLGTFRITQKKADHVSNLYGAPMPYMLRLTNDGVAIHGSEVEQDAATNGCIGVPTEFAELLFREARLGDRVIITDGKMMDLGGAVTG